MATGIQLSPESLCDGLDQLCIQRLEVMDKLIKSNMMLEESMRGGFFLLGKTRYNMGTKAVSTLQLPTKDREVDALATAVTTPVPLQGYDGDILYQHVDTKFQDPVLTLEEDDTLEENETDNLSEGLRKRHKGIVGSEVAETSKEEDPSYNTNSGREIKTINRDPIRWFSALPPQTLRQAQSEFKSALQLSAQCATLQLRLRSVNKEYKRLMKIKSKIERLEKEP